jgi:hypothetical protein
VDAEVAKYLLEFHGVCPSRETMKMAISTGVLELIRNIWGRLSENQREYRADLLQAAADFHHPDILAWLLREASPLERESFGEFALERHLADAVIVATDNGLRLWSKNARARIATWSVASTLQFVAPPDGLSIDCGWWLDLCGKASAIEPDGGEWVIPQRIPRELVAHLVLPFGVAQLGRNCLAGCEALARFSIPQTVTEVGWFAFAWCRSLKRLVFPASVKSIDASIDWECSDTLQIVAAADTEFTVNGI